MKDKMDMDELNKRADREIKEAKELNKEAEEVLKRTEGLFD